MFDLIILATLFDGPKHGYQIKREAGLILGKDDLHNNLVYPLLKKFAAAGWVTKKAAPGERGQTRQEYTITGPGKAALIQRLNEFSDADAKSFEAFVTRVGMFELLEKNDRKRILEGREAYLHERLRAINVLPEKMDLGLFGGEVVGFLRERIQSELTWIQPMRQLAKSED